MRFGEGIAFAIPAGLLLLGTLTRGRFGANRLLVVALILLATALTVLGLWTSSSSVASEQDLATWNAFTLLATKTWSGRVTLLRLGLAMTGLLLSSAAPRFARLGSLACLVAALFLIPFSGHAVTAEPVVLSLALHGIHAACVLSWSGAVVVLAVAAFRRAGRADLMPVVRVFSAAAVALVTAGIAAGVAAGWLQSGQAAALFGTAYGQLDT